MRRQIIDQRPVDHRFQGTGIGGRKDPDPVHDLLIHLGVIVHQGQPLLRRRHLLGLNLGLHLVDLEEVGRIDRQLAVDQINRLAVTHAGWVVGSPLDVPVELLHQRRVVSHLLGQIGLTLVGPVFELAERQRLQLVSGVHGGLFSEELVEAGVVRVLFRPARIAGCQLADPGSRFQAVGESVEYHPAVGVFGRPEHGLAALVEVLAGLLAQQTVGAVNRHLGAGLLAVPVDFHLDGAALGIDQSFGLQG